MTAALREAPLSASLVDGYSARHLTVLEGLEAVRKRPGMYIGSTDERGMLHCLWEIIDNSVDEALNGSCTKIEVILHADGSVEVRDNGRGIPVDMEPKTGLNGVEVVMTRLHAGGKFGGGSYTASGGLHGVGASVVNALSARLDVEVDREGTSGPVSFRRGVPGEFSGDGPEARSSSRALACASCGRVPKGRTGTRIAVLAGPADLHPRRADGVRRAGRAGRQTAYLVPGLSHRGHRRAGSEEDASRRRPSSTSAAASASSAPTWPRRAGHRRAQADRDRPVHRDRAGTR